MTAEQFVTAAFLLVSIVALSVQSAFLAQIHRQPSRPGLTRTAACRVAASVVYVLVGLNAATIQYAVLQVTFAAFLLTQAVWMVNGWLDGRAPRPKRPSPHRTETP